MGNSQANGLSQYIRSAYPKAAGIASIAARTRFAKKALNMYVNF